MNTAAVIAPRGDSVVNPEAGTVSFQEVVLNMTAHGGWMRERRCSG